jgi:hypothetical protein
MTNEEYQEGRPPSEHRKHKQPTQEGWDTAPNILRGKSKSLRLLTRLGQLLLTGAADVQSN